MARPSRRGDACGEPEILASGRHSGAGASWPVLVVDEDLTPLWEHACGCPSPRAILRGLPEAAMLLVPLLALACAPRIAYTSPVDDTGGDGGAADTTGDGGTGDGSDTGDTGTAPDYSEYDGATLQIVSPQSGEFYPLGEGVPFEAHVLAADGSELPFDGIQWTTDIDSSWSGSGSRFTDDLTVGLHDISAVAALPNGDRLGWTVGGVLVQAEDAGTYVGDLSVDFTVDYNGTVVTTTCFGAATVIVDAWGQVATGDSSCNVSLLGYELNTTYQFDFDVADQQLDGQAILDLVLFQSQFDATGAVGDGALSADWTNNLLGYIDFTGQLDLSRISRDTGE